ncbi:TonB-dependent receptor, partial [uncultured Sphingomonas sp.]|uniref:TonB-dependent receptor n=1 Tax=uncultured Sphingomonas sp. TaxID=158754 RepID=UPI002607B724
MAGQTSLRSRLIHAPVGVALLLSAVTPATAQKAARPAPPPQSDDEDSGIVVNGVRPPLPGAVVGDIPPELQYSPADIRAYGVSSVSDLLNELAPEIRSDRGRGSSSPVVLLNGRRISAFSEIQDIPTEAILRVDILPEEVALKYGYTADQKVVNIVLRRRFHSITGEANGLTTTDGGAESGTGDFNVLRIRGDNRLNLDLKATDTAALRESQRDIVSSTTGRPYDLVGNVTGVGDGDLAALGMPAGQPVSVAGIPAAIAAGGAPTLAGFAGTANDPNVTDITPYRTIGSSAKTVSLNSVLAHPFGKHVNATLNGTFGYSDSGSLRGLPSANLLVPSDDPFNPFGQDVDVARYLGTDALRQDIQTITAHLGTTVNADVAKWRLSFTAGYDYGDTRTDTDTGLDTSALQAALADGDPTVDPFGTLPASLIGGRTKQMATAISNAGNVQFVANGPVFDVPAGPLSTSLKAGFTDSGFDTRSDRGGVVQRTSLSRSDASAQLNIDLPIASAKHHFLPFLGTLSANTNLAVDHYNDFGTETTLGYGLNWTPHDGITLIASTTHDHGIPTVQQLAAPVVVTPQVPVYDYLTGQTVNVSETAGGNAGLQADSRHVDKLGLTLKPFKAIDLTLSASYIRSDIRNAIAAFPSPSAAIEAAFPDRFVRDAEGDLDSIDERPINFARERRQEIRWGVNFTQKLKTSQALIDAYRALRASGAFQRPGGGG